MPPPPLCNASMRSAAGVLAGLAAVILAQASLCILASVAPVMPATRKREATVHSPLMHAKTLDDWLQPASLKHPGLLLARRPFWKDCQVAVDRDDAWRRRTVRLCRGATGFGDLSHAADELLKTVTLPQDVREAVRGDVLEVGSVVDRLCPSSCCLEFKLERIGEDCCTRWHRDNYVARAIISYNSAATVYTPDQNVDLWQLDNGGKNEQIIKDPSKCCSANVGDVFLMKGKKFPCGPKGLIHKSPAIQYHHNGRVLNRLVLKVDVP